MSRISTKKRIIALALCFLMVMSLFPSSAFADNDVVGRTATFAADGMVKLYGDPARPDMYSMVAPSQLPQSVVITEVSGDYYKIIGADGTWPEGYVGLNYVLSTELTLDEIETPDPSDPVNPSESSDPSESSEPSKPSEPENPSEPTKPSEPSKPTDPSEPTKPTDPETPSEPENENTTFNTECGVSISGSLPEGAAPAASVVESNIYDIKILNADGTEWQPIDEGKTVTIQIPVTGVADGEYVDVYHFIDYAPDIDGDEEIISVAGAGADTLALLNSAIDAYYEKTGVSGYVAVEVVEKAMVSNGSISVDTNSFSVYIYDEDEGEYVLVEDENGVVTFDNSGDNKDALYVGPNSTFTLRTQNIVAFDVNKADFFTVYSVVDSQNNSIANWSDFVSLENDDDWGIFSRANADLIIGDLPVGTKIIVRFQNDNIVDVTFNVVGEIKLSYDANGQNGATVPSEQRAVSDGNVSFTVQNIEKTPDDVTFEGWNTSRGGDGTSYTVAELNAGTAVIKPTKDTTLYAMWEKKNYTIKYDLRGGDGSSGNFNDQTKTYGVDLELRTDVPTREGYKFLGWSTTTDGSTKIYEPGDFFKANADATLYAIWGVKVDLSIDNGGTITFYNDKYEETPENNSTSLGGAYSNYEIEGSHANCKLEFIPDENYVITGVKINDVSLNSGFTESGYTYEIGSTGFTADTKIEVTTAPVSYTIRYEKNLPEGVTSTVPFPEDGTKTYNVDYTIADAEDITAYSFNGWNTAADGRGTSYNAGTTYSENDDLTLYAQWTPKYKYVVTFDANAPENATVTDMPEGFGTDWIDGKTYTVSVTNPTCTGYSFLGWNTDPAAETGSTNKSYVLNGTDAGTTEVTLYAIWNINTYTINYEVSGKDGVTLAPTTGVEFGSQIATKLVTMQNIDGYTWSGWKLDDNIITNQTMPDNDITVKGEYIPNDYTIIFKYDDGATAEVKYPYTIASIITISNPTRTYYTFTGWKVTEIDDEEGNWERDEEVKPNDGAGDTKIPERKYGNVTLTAQWQRKTEDFTILHTVQDNDVHKDPAEHSLTYKFTITGVDSSELSYNAVLYKPNDSKEPIYTFGYLTAQSQIDLQLGWYLVLEDLPAGVTVTVEEVHPQNDDPFYTLETQNIKNATTDGNADTVNDNKIVFTNQYKQTEHYRIAYYQQNLDGTYPATATDTRQYNHTDAGCDLNGDIGSQPVIPNAYLTAPTGFVLDHVEYTNITADGQAVMKVYFKRIERTVTYSVEEDLPSGYSVPAPTTHKFGETVQLEPKPQYDGYTFEGWYVDNQEATSVNIGTENLTITGRFIRNEYTIRFVGGDESTGVPDDMKIFYQETKTLPTQTPTWTNFKFLGWSKTEGAETPDYNAGGSFTKDDLDEVTILYAVWDPVPYTISYTVTGDIPDGYTAPTSDYSIAGRTVTVKDAADVTGYTFSGWTTEDATVTDGAFIMPGKNVAFTGIFTVNQDAGYTVKYVEKDSNPEIALHDPKVVSNKTFGEPFTETAPVIEGYTTTPASTVINAGYDVEYTFYYTPNTYRVIYITQVEGMNVPSVQASYGTEVTVDGETLTRDHYTFLGWQCGNNSCACHNTPNPIYHMPGDKLIMPAGDLYLYAQWKPVEYTITYNPNGGDMAEAERTEKYTVEYPIDLNATTRKGYTFGGWKVIQSDVDCWKLGDVYTGQVPVGKYGDVTLQAQWTINMVELKITSTGAEQSIIKLTGETYGDETVELMIAFNGTGTKTVTIPAGKYKVEAMMDWSWRYDVQIPGGNNNCDIETGSHEFTFEFNQINPYWLDDCGYKVN